MKLRGVNVKLKVACLMFLVLAGSLLNAKASLPNFQSIIIDSTIQANSHKPKVFAVFSMDGYNDLGSLDSQGFKLYRYTRHWKAYSIFQPGAPPSGFEDSSVADINGDGWNDIVLGGWANRTIWAENPEGEGKDPYTTPWKVHVVDTKRFSHEVVAAHLTPNGKCDIVTTSGIYFQGKTPDDWTYVDIGRGGQGTCVGNVLHNHDGYKDVVAIYVKNGKNQIAWFENPGHTGRNPITEHWKVHIIDPNPGGDEDNRDMDEMALTFGDINGDGRPDIIAASMGEGPDPMNDERQIGDGLVWYECPANPRTGVWVKHVIDPTVAWVHATSIQLADFGGDGHTDICFAEQDQSRMRKDGKPGQLLGIYYNVRGNGTVWRLQTLSQYPDQFAGGFNSRVGIIGKDKLPSILTSRHGFFNDPNPLILWRNRSKPLR